MEISYNLKVRDASYASGGIMHHNKRLMNGFV